MRLPTTLIIVIAALGFCSSLNAQSQQDHAVSIINDRPLSARVLGGGEAEAGDYPSIVALVSPGFSSLDRRLFCGGTMVAERWVLTAAHCVLDARQQPRAPGLIRVVAGITDLAVDSSEVEEIRVEQVVVHPDYDTTLELPPNDIALLELESEPGVPVATLFAGDTDLYTDTFGFIAGWGAIEYSDPDNAVYPTTLQDASVPLVSNELCNAPQSYDGILANSHLCAGFVDGQVDACAGDSGGPLYLNIDGEQVQVGIVSFGNGCGLPLFYGIYTDISYHIAWLGEYIPVPYQSPELVALRLKKVNNEFAGGGSDNDPFIGQLGGASCLALLMMMLIRWGSPALVRVGRS